MRVSLAVGGPRTTVLIGEDAPPGGQIPGGWMTPALRGLAIDRHGSIFVTDFMNDALYQLPAGGGTPTAVVTDWDSAVGGYDTARVTCPAGVAVDATGVVVFTDGSNRMNGDGYRLRRVAASPDRALMTVTPASKAVNFDTCVIAPDGSVLIVDPKFHRVHRVTGLGLVSPRAPRWTLRAHRAMARSSPAVAAFVATVLRCAHRIDVEAAACTTKSPALPRLPFEMWMVIISLVSLHGMCPE